MVASSDALPPYDTLFTGGTLIDGTGRTAFRSDLAIKGDRIAAIGELRGTQAAEEIDIRGKCLAPGFIDTHTHDDQACMSVGSMAPKLSQGVTTVVVGNCGVSLAPLDHPPLVPEPINLLGEPQDFRYRDFGSYFDAVDAARPSTNVIALVGHSSLRVAAMRDLERPATRSELDTMLGILEDAMRAGAGGLSSGVFYPLGRPADSSEVIPLVGKAGEHGGIYASHIRDEHDGVLDSMQEAFEAARVGGADLVVFDPLTVADRATYESPEEAAAGIDHVFVNGQRSWGGDEGSLAGHGRLLRRGDVESS